MDDTFTMLFASLSDMKAAGDIAEALVLRKLAAAVDIVPQVKSVRASKNHEVKTKTSALLLIKTQRSKSESLIEYMKHNTPDGESLDVTSMRVDKGNVPFLRWIKEMTTASSLVPESLI